MSEAAITAVSLILVSLIGLVGVVIQQGKKTRRENTEQHADGRSIGTEVLGHVLDLHKKVDGVHAQVEAVTTDVKHNGIRVDSAMQTVENVGSRIEEVAGLLDKHLSDVNEHMHEEHGELNKHITEATVEVTDLLVAHPVNDESPQP